MKGYVYILEDERGTLYIGSTSDLERRLREHARKTTHTLKRLKFPKLVLSQAYPTLLEARHVELKLKKLKRKDYIKKIISDGYIKIKP